MTRWIIGYKNLLRAVEFSGVAGILGLEYLSNGNLADIKYQSFLKSEALRREYLNQSFNFLPFLEVRSILDPCCLHCFQFLLLVNLLRRITL